MRLPRDISPAAAGRRSLLVDVVLGVLVGVSAIVVAAGIGVVGFVALLCLLAVIPWYLPVRRPGCVSVVTWVGPCSLLISGSLNGEPGEDAAWPGVVPPSASIVWARIPRGSTPTTTAIRKRLMALLSFVPCAYRCYGAGAGQVQRAVDKAISLSFLRSTN